MNVIVAGAPEVAVVRLREPVGITFWASLPVSCTRGTAARRRHRSSMKNRWADHSGYS